MNLRDESAQMKSELPRLVPYQDVWDSVGVYCKLDIIPWAIRSKFGLTPRMQQIELSFCGQIKEPKTVAKQNMTL